MTDTPLTAPDVNLLANIGYKYALETMTTEQLRARVAELTAALTEQGLLQKTASGSMVWHAHDCPASFDFGECNYRCRVAREAFALAGTEPYVSAETRRDTEAYE